MRRRTLLALGGLAVLGAALAFALGSETALRLATSRVEGWTRGRVAISGASGSLLGPLRAERVVITARGGTRTIALHSTLAPRWRALARGALALDAVEIGELRIEPGPAPSEPPTVPRSLALPFALEIDRVAIAKLTIAPRTQLTDVRGQLVLGRGEHRAELTRLVSPWGTLTGHASVATAPPFALRGELAVARDAPPLARATALASGDLVAAELALTGSLGTAPVTGRVRFASFARPWLTSLALRGEHVDPADFVRSESAPHGDLAVTVEATGDAEALARGTLRAENAAPGSLDHRALPLKTLRADLRLAGGVLGFAHVDGDLGPAGTATGDGRLESGVLHLALAVKRLDLRALHASLRATQLAGRIESDVSAERVAATLALAERGRTLRGRVVREGVAVRAEDVHVALGGGEITGGAAWDGARAFSVRAQLVAFDPSSLGAFPRASLSGEVDAAGDLGERWDAHVTYALRGSRFRGRALEGRGALTLAASRLSRADAELRLGANRLHARGAFGAPGDALELSLQAPDLAALGGEFAGALAVDAQLLGSAKQPGGALRVSAQQLALPGGVRVGGLVAEARVAASGARTLAAHVHADDCAFAGFALDDANASAEGTLGAHRIALDAAGGGDAVHAELAGGWDGAWVGDVTDLTSQGRLAVRLLAPARFRYEPPARLDFGPARLAALGGEISLGSLALVDRRVESAGVAVGLSLADALVALGRDPAAAGDLRIRGVWVVPLDPAQLGQVRLELDSGDAQLAGAPLGLRALTIDAALGERTAHVAASVSGERLGRADLRASLAAAADRALLARSSTLDASLDADLESIRAIGGLLGISARVEGRGSLRLTAGGTVGRPDLHGDVSADGLRFDWPSAGIALRNGTLRARVEPDALHVAALSFAAGDGELRAHGDVPLDGRPAQLAWQAENLRVLDRPDRNLVVSGEGDASVDAGRLALRGALKAKQGYIEVPRIEQSKLGDDVVVLGDPRSEAEAKSGARLDLDLELDAGKKLRVVGAGLDTVLRGKVRLKTLPDGTLAAFGEIDTTRGTYRAFGQKLEIDRGALIFNGALDDPALDVLALRKNLAVEAGVALTGTLKQPLAQLVSNPPVPDSEKLSWIVLGHGVSDASSADTALLQAAAATIFSGDGAVPIGQRIAQGVGLDEISLRNTGEQGTQEATGRAVALGKRLSDKLYLEYEYGLEAASHLVRLHYTLTRAFSVRVETTGDTSNVGVNFRRSWD